MKKLLLVLVLLLALCGCQTNKTEETKTEPIVNETSKGVFENGFVGKFTDDKNHSFIEIKEEEGLFKATIELETEDGAVCLWTMTVARDGNKLCYNDGTYSIIRNRGTADESISNSYEAMPGYLTLTKDGILWDGSRETACRSMLFVGA